MGAFRFCAARPPVGAGGYEAKPEGATLNPPWRPGRFAWPQDAGLLSIEELSKYHLLQTVDIHGNGLSGAQASVAPPCTACGVAWLRRGGSAAYWECTAPHPPRPLCGTAATFFCLAPPGAFAGWFC